MMRPADNETKIVRDMLNAMRDEQIAHPHPLVRNCESPIERLLAWGLVLDQSALSGDAWLVPPCPMEKLATYLGHWSMPLAITVGTNQCVVGDYRVDFLFYAKRAGHTDFWLAVECDGHDFHEKTKEQAQKDKSRDREVLALGVQTIRFTGSEIWMNPLRCADVVYGLISDYHTRIDNIGQERARA